MTDCSPLSRPIRAQSAESTDEAAWVSRGRAAYDLHGTDSVPDVLSARDAEITLVRRLGAGIRSLPHAHQDAAIAAAVRGYLDAHRALGRAVAGDDPAPPTTASSATRMGMLDDLLTRTSGSTTPIIRPHGSGVGNARRLRVATFALAERHPITKGLSGGRARILPGEDALQAVSRRIARDTRCAILGVTVDSQGADGAKGTFWRCRLTVRGSLGPEHRSASPVEVELNVTVRDFGANDPPL